MFVKNIWAKHRFPHFYKMRVILVKKVGADEKTVFEKKGG